MRLNTNLLDTNLLEFGDVLKWLRTKVIDELSVGVSVHLLSDQSVIAEHSM